MKDNQYPPLPQIRSVFRTDSATDETHTKDMWRNEMVSINDGKIKTQMLVDCIQKIKLPQDSKIICVPGGIGRHADAIRKLGYNVTNLDRNKEWLDIGRKHFPMVNHLEGNFEEAHKYVGQYDLALFEDVIDGPYDESEFRIVNSWSNVCDVYPKEKNLKLFKFNSTLIDQVYNHPLYEMNKIIKEQMGFGNLEMRVTIGEVDSYTIESVICKGPEWQIKVDPSGPEYKYQLLGDWLNNDALGHKAGFRGLMCGAGFHRKMLRKNKKDYGMINVDT